MSTESQNTAIAKSSPAHPVERLRAQLEQRSEELKRALPAHMPVERFIRNVLTACAKNPDLYTVDRTSFLLACLNAAHDGLQPDGRDGVILPYRDKNKGMIAQWQPMIGGLLKRFRNSGQFLSITAGVVRESDPFEYWIDENGEHLRHTPGDVGPYTKAYAMAKTKDGGTMIKVMSKAEIDRRRAVSKAKDGPMWKDWWDEAAMKTVLRNLSKRLPSSADLDELVQRDEDDDAFQERPVLPREASREVIKEDGDIETTVRHYDQPIEEPYHDERLDKEAAMRRDDAAPDDDLPQGDDPNASSDQSDVERAFAEGAEARRVGHARRAVPGPYRAPEASHLARSWWAGWDSAEQRS
jgi:recombination protein RecT